MRSVTTESMGTVLRQGGAHVGRLIRGHPIAFSVAVFGSTMFVSAIAIAAVVIGDITDTVIIPVLDGGEPYADRLRPAVLLVASIALYKAVGIIIRRVGASWLQIRSQMDFVSRLIHHQYRLSMPWHHGEDTGDLLAITDNDAGQATFVLGPLPYATGVSLLLVGSLVLVTSIDVWLGLVAMVSFGLVVTADVGSAWFIFGGFEKLQRMVGDVSAVAHESFDGALTVKAIGAEELEVERFTKVSNALRDQRTWVSTRAETFRTFSEIIPAIGLVAVIVVGGFRIQAGAITPGDVVTALYLMSLLSFPIRLIGFVTWETTFALASWRRIARIVEADDIIQHGETRPSEQPTGTSVEGDAVTFSYPGGTAVLSGLTFDIKPGETVAIVGPTASGKSTMVSLLARLWDPSMGAIHLDGRDLRDFAERGVAAEVTIVPQEAFLFNLSVRENITLGQEFSEDDVRAAADLAQATAFIEELPDGFDTIVGEQGATLSGGQAQRIALARSIIRKPRLLILDDATSAIDPSVETAILTGLRDAELPSTVVIVAYRQASIALADRVVLIHEGRIAATGTHEELLASQPVYSEILTAYADV
ncbi:MAG: ABC transporter ATP-binding protein [Acidimicrobiia bacterium]|nr:ABC transporter ATP-binding protein [Acidimicrobiia bacterium]